MIRLSRLHTPSCLIVAALALLFLAACGSGSETAVTPAAPTATEAASVSDTAVSPTEPPAAITEPATPTAVAPDEPTTRPTDAPPPTETAVPVAPVSAISLNRVLDGFTKPLYLTHVPSTGSGQDERLFVVEQAGLIRIVQDGQIIEPPFLDIRDRVNDGASEQGLLSVAFHPGYAENGRFYVNYTRDDGSTVVARYLVTDDPNQADPASEQILLTVAQPYNNHNGGLVKFGPDGYLYVGMGDGGSAGDPHNHGQNPATLLGTMLRLDVDGSEPYAIPPDNPFGDEVWAYGLRNPWRFSFDSATGDLFIGDVGQNIYEEISFQPAGSPGGQNYGWNILEGTHCYEAQSCDEGGTVLPIAEYSHAQGGCSITGGYVYRGQQFPGLTGNYFFADYCSGFIWGLFPAGDGSWTMTQVFDSDSLINSFGEDAAGELYVVDHNGSLWQIQP